jgi:3-hydroxybutyryl-CoA dehydrogenase
MSNPIRMTPYALVGPLGRRQEFLQRVPEPAPAYAGDLPPARHDLPKYGLLVDLSLDQAVERLAIYAHYPNLTVLGCAVHRSLQEMVYLCKGEISCRLFGLNALPTFIDRPVWELSCYQVEEQPKLTTLAQTLNVEVAVVQDQVGMVTPRTLFLIMNEAFAVMEEGTASAEDIDQAMRLGTNYPKGPVAWAREIGLDQVVGVLDRLREHTGSSRYAAAPLMQQEMMGQVL